MRTTHLETDLLSVKNQVKGVEQLTDDVKILHQQAEAAGTLEQWLALAWWHSPAGRWASTPSSPVGHRPDLLLEVEAAANCCSGGLPSWGGLSAAAVAPQAGFGATEVR